MFVVPRGCVDRAGLFFRFPHESQDTGTAYGFLTVTCELCDLLHLFADPPSVRSVDLGRPPRDSRPPRASEFPIELRDIGFGASNRALPAPADAVSEQWLAHKGRKPFGEWPPIEAVVDF